MKIRYRDTTIELEDMPLDLGYASEKVELKNDAGTLFCVGGQNGSTQLLISLPFFDEAQIKELDGFTSLLTINALGGITKCLITANAASPLPHLDEWLIGTDSDEAFGDYYGARLSGGKLSGQLAKALFVISKDGALFYSQIVSDLDAPFDLDKALIKIAAAQNCYTGKGCHG